jgi:hypothetical protein
LELSAVDERDNLAPLGVGFIMIAVASLQLPIYVTIPLVATGLMFIAWSVYGERLRPLLIGGEWGRQLVRAMDWIAEATTSHDEFHPERKAIVDRQWQTLSERERLYLKAVLLHGRQDATANHAADSLRTKGLIIDGQYGLPATIAPKFRSIIAAKFQDQAAPKSP